MARSEKSDIASLWDMLDACRTVRRFVCDRTFVSYLSDQLLKSGVERQIEIIGEAASKVSEATQALHPAIPWRRIIAQRHILAHEYAELEDELIWQVATVHLPELITLLEPLVSDSTEQS